MTWDKRLYFPSEGRRAEVYSALKNPTASAGFEPANLCTSRPPKPLSVMQLFFVIPLYKCCWYFRGQTAFRISVLQLPFVFPRDNFPLYFELSLLTVLNQFNIQQILARLSFLKVVALRLLELDPNYSVLSILYPLATF